MSSGVDSGGVIAAAVMLPVGVAVGAVLGAGWLAWQGGNLLIEANRTADKKIAEKKRQLEEAAMHRKRSALAVHSQLVDMCSQLLTRIEGNSATASVIDFAELEQLRTELRDICNEYVPEDVIQIESLNSLGFLKLEKMVAKQQYLSSLQIEENSSGLYRGLSLADLMLDMKVAISAMEIQATNGNDIRVADPIVLERAKLNEKLSNVTARTMEALEYVAKLSSSYGLTPSNSAWFHSCFNGVDEQIAVLYMPSTSNAELKKGIKRLEGLLEQYDMLIPTIENDQKRFVALYQIYADASKALGEQTENIKSFKSLKELEKSLTYLKRRSEKAQECAEIYQKLGPEAYICYAWDQELQALGYSVHTRKDIAEMAEHKPQYARLGESKLPFYNWNNNDLTQLYFITSSCSLQLIVHDDGSVSMQTISDVADGEVRAAQAGHCAILGKLHENLRKNWFVMYDFQETASPDEITSFANWFGTEDSAWKPESAEFITEQRRKEKSKSQTKQS